MITTTCIISGGFVAARNPSSPASAKELLMPLLGSMLFENIGNRKGLPSFSLANTTSLNPGSWVTSLRPLLVDRAGATLR